MRFLQTADWHIGRRLHGYDLLTDQAAIMTQIKEVALQHHVDALVIAGDLYDRAAPSEDAVALLNAQLVELNLTHHLPLLAISGNHDSAIRLNTGQPWYANTQFHLNTTLAQALQPVTMGDTQFFLLPYFEPFAARQFFHDETLTTVTAAIARLVTAMVALFDPTKQHVLVAHFFASGSQRSDSETQVQVGGLNAVPTDLLAPFDYVALGHLHRRTALTQVPHMKYSGAPLKFSTSEATDVKGVWLVDTASPVTETFIPLKPQHDLVVLKDSFDHLMDARQVYDVAKDDFVAIELTDAKPITNVMQRLKERFPRIIELRRVTPLALPTEVASSPAKIPAPMTLLTDYFTALTQQALSPTQQQLAESALSQANQEMNQ